MKTVSFSAVALFLCLSLTVTGQIRNTPLLSSDISTGTTADASIENVGDLSIVVEAEFQSVTAISATAETDYRTPTLYGRPTTGSTTADASIRNQGSIFASTIGYTFSSGIESTVDASNFAGTTNAPSTSDANALGSIVNEGEIRLVNGGRGLATSVNVESTATTYSSAPIPARSFASATGDGSVQNYSSINITHASLSLANAIVTDVKAESSAIGTVFWTPPPPDPLIVVIETEANARADGSVENHGNLSLSGVDYGSSYGIKTQAEVISGGSFSSAQAEAGVLNTGDISLSMSNGFYAYGIHTEASGRISASSNGEVSGTALANVLNYGDFNIRTVDSQGAFGIQTMATLIANARGGVVKQLLADVSVSNYGSIGIFSAGESDAYGIYISSSLPYGYEAELLSEVYNAGSIYVEALSSEVEPTSGNATGVYFENGGEIHSAGLIEAHSQGGEAYQVVSEKNLTITAYSIKFGPDVVSDFQGVIRAGESVLFDDAILFASISDDFVDGIYEIPELVEGNWERSGDGSMEESFTSVISQIEIPDFQVQLLPPDSSSAQRVDIRYAPSASFTNKSMRLSGDLIQQANFRVRQRLLSSVFSKQIASEKDEMGGFSPEHEVSVSADQFYGSPVYSNSQVDSDPVGYRADTYGFEVGYAYEIASHLNVGLIGGYSESSVDFTGVGFDSRVEDLELFYGGLDGVLRVSDRLALIATSIYYETSNSYEDHSLSNTESADYRGRGLNSSLSLAYQLPIPNARHSLTSRIGISHLWQGRDSFVTSNETTVDVAYGSITADHLYSHIGLDWSSRYELSNWSVSPQLSLEIRKAVGDEDLTHVMSVGNSNSRVTDTRDSLQYQGMGSISLHRNNCDLTAGIALHESEEASAYSLLLRFGYRF